MCIKKTEKDYYDLAKSRNFVFVGPMPKNTHTRTLWQCSKGHRWETSYRSIQHGNGCHVCSGNIVKTEQDYHNLAESRGFKCIGPIPKNVNTKTEWICSKKHRWFVKYNGIQQGLGCPYCANKVSKTEQDYHNLAKSRGFEFIGLFPKITRHNTEWCCIKGHVWRACYGSINSGSGCPFCYGNGLRTVEDYHNLAKLKGFKFVDTLPKNITIPVKWRCSKGHVWKACYGNIQQGTGCPQCQNRINGSMTSRQQENLYKYIYGMDPVEDCDNYNVRVGTKYVDIAFCYKNIKIALEYDCQYWHKEKKEKDKKRDDYLISKGWRVLHILSALQIPTKKELNKILNKFIVSNNSSYYHFMLDWK